MLIFIIALILTPSLAYSYLDPGSGAVLVNLIVAGVLALLYLLKGIFFRLIGRKGDENKSKKVQKEIGILSEGKQYWATFKPIIEAFINSQISFCYYTLDIEDPALTIDSEYMESRFLGYGAWAFSRASNLKTKYLLSTTPNIGCPDYPIKKPRAIVELIHVFHSINDISMYRKGSLDHYDTVFLVGEFQASSIREIEAKRKLTPKNLVILGLPYLDVYKKNVLNEQRNKDVTTILIGSSWGDKGLLNFYGPEFIRQIAAYGYQVIVRPHPRSFVAECGLIQRLKLTLQYLHNVVWDETLSPSESMNVADLLISDTSSLRFDFAFLYHKPVITLEIPAQAMPGYERDDLDSIWSDNATKEIGYSLSKEHIRDITDYIEKALAEYYPQRIKTFRDNTIAHFGESGLAIAEYFKQRINSSKEAANE